MLTQSWPLLELRQVAWEGWKIIAENGGWHPTGLHVRAMLYLPRSTRGRGLRLVEQDYKLIKNSASLKVYENPDPMIQGSIEDLRRRQVKDTSIPWVRMQ